MQILGCDVPEIPQSILISFYFILSSKSLICSASSHLLLIPCSVFFISFIVFLMSDQFFVKVFSELIHSSLKSSEHLYNYCFELSGKLVDSISFRFFPEVLSCSVIWSIFICFLILFGLTVLDSVNWSNRLPFPVLKDWPCIGRAPL